MTKSDVKTVLPSELTIQVGDEELLLSPLTPGDWSKLESFLVSERLAEVIERNRHLPMSDDVRAKTVSSVVCEVIDIPHILTSPSCQLYAVWLSLKKANTVPAFKQFKETFKPDLPFGTIVDVVMILSGMLKVEDPLASAAELLTTTSGTTA